MAGDSWKTIASRGPNSLHLEVFASDSHEPARVIEMMSITMRVALCAAVCTATFVLCLPTASAQCQTCPTPAPTVVYQPVIAQAPVVQPAVVLQQDNRWYPGKLLDQMRMRRWSRWASRRATTTAVVPTTYAVSYQPTWATAACTTCPQTTFRPVVMQSAASCCPQTTYRPVVLQPAASCCPAPVTSCAPCLSACDTSCIGCSACSTCPGGVSQATFQAPASSDCVGCATGFDTTTTLSTPSSQPMTTFGDPQPALVPDASSQEVRKPAVGETEAGTNSRAVDPAPVEDKSTRLRPLELFNPDPRNRTTNRGQGRVRSAIYRHPTRSVYPTRSAHETGQSQVERDAAGWQITP